MGSLHLIDFALFTMLASDSMVKSSWQFLWSSSLEFRMNIIVKQPRQNYILIMKGAHEPDLGIAGLMAVNKC
jgi:hypothetical protein